MPKNFVAKFRVLVLSVSCLFLVVAFQNCGKSNSLLGASANSLAQSEPASTTPDPIADPPVDNTGQGRPEKGPIATNKISRVSIAPDCFTLSAVGEIPETGELIVRAQLLSQNFSVPNATAGNLLLAGKANVLKIPAASIDSEAGVLEFHLTQSQLESSSISGVFAGLGFNVVINKCL